MFTEVRKAMNEESTNFNREIENIKQCQTEIIKLKNIIIRLKKLS